MKNIKLILEYDGTNYHGWQSQRGSGKATIQETLEQAIEPLAGERCVIHSSGRTDAGVHAVGHVANFTTAHAMPASAWRHALNSLLPADIRVVASSEVPVDFHARYSAIGKQYKYLLLHRDAPSALYRHYAWHIDRALNLGAMRRAASLLVGSHDFSAFRSAGCGAASPVRNITRIVIGKSRDFIEISLEADAFLMHMARAITGTLVEAGLGRFSVHDVESILKSRDRSQAGRTAPAQGLYLVKVYYPDS